MRAQPYFCRTRREEHLLESAQKRQACYERPERQREKHDPTLVVQWAIQESRIDIRSQYRQCGYPQAILEDCERRDQGEKNCFAPQRTQEQVSEQQPGHQQGDAGANTTALLGDFNLLVDQKESLTLP